MNSEEKFKETLNNLLSEKEFSFQPEEWPKAEAIIDGERKKKRVFFILFTLLILFMGSSAFFVFNEFGKDNLAVNTKQIVEKASETSLPKAEEPAIKKVEEPTLKQSNKITETEKQENNSNSVSSNENKISEVNTTSDVRSNDPSVTSSAPDNDRNETKAIKQKKNTVEVRSNTPSLASSGVETKALKGKKNPAEIKAINTSVSSNVTETKKSKAVSTKKENIKTVEEKIAVAVSPKRKTKNIPAEKTSSTKNENGSGNNVPENYEGTSPAITGTKKDTLKQDETIPSVFNYTLSTQTPTETSNSQTDFSIPVKKADTAQVTTTKDLAELVSLNVIQRHIFSVEAGTNYLLGWKNTEIREGNGFNAIFGLNYYNVISGKIGLSAGVQYNSLHNFKNTVHTAKITTYKFGEENQVTSISALKMHYVAFPFKLHYSIDPNNFIGVGYNLVYLIDVKSKVETYSEKANMVANYSSSISNGYRGGFNNMDGQFSLFYRRNIYKELYFNAEVFYGLKDIKNNDGFNSNTSERNMGIKLTLNYNFLKK